ncbi:MAG: hypothetical protein DRH97_00430 [Chloroflexi bacterium]|nr:MAG: hypothetical protein DRH97_00430 [Chloroflexota bacterium]
MKFDVTAVIKEVGAIETVGAKGFQKRNLVLSEESGEYENIVCVEFSGDKLELPEKYTAGQTVKVGGFINCREWNGKYFTSLRGNFIQTDRSEGVQQPPPQQFGQAPQVQTPQQPATSVYQSPNNTQPAFSASDQAQPQAEDDIPF